MILRRFVLRVGMTRSYLKIPIYAAVTYEYGKRGGVVNIAGKGLSLEFRGNIFLWHSF